MADYKIKIGTELDTSGIKKTVDGYKGNINVGAIVDTSGIAKTLSSYRAPHIEVESKLNTQGITDDITKYGNKANRKKIKVDVEPIFDGIEGIIKNKHFNTPLKVDVELNWAGVAKQIANPNLGANGSPKLNVDVDLNDDAIASAIDRYVKNGSTKTIPIKIKPDFSELNWNQVETLLGEYTARTPLKVNVELSKTRINQQISEYNQTAQSDNGRTILLKARLTDNAVADAVSNYKVGNAEKLKIPIDLTFNSNAEFDANLKQKIQAYENTPVEIPVKLKPAEKGFTSQISKLPVYIDAVLKNADDINGAINAYSNNPVPVAAKLVRGKGFDSELTKSPVKIQATLDPDSVNNSINNFKPASKLRVGVKLEPTDVNSEVKGLQKPTEPLNIGVKLDDESVNAAIALFQPTATLGIKPDLMLENVDDQIRAYVPQAKVKVNIDLDDSINAETGKQSSRPPVEVNVRLNREDINDQIRKFRTTTKIKVGVKLDFASHKDEAGKEIQKGISKQIKDYETKTKIKVGVQLDKDSINQAIQGFDTDTPIKLGVELNTENVQGQIDNIRHQLQELEDIRIDIGGNVSRITREMDDVDNIDNIISKKSSISNVVQELREVDIKIESTEDQITNLGRALRSIGFNDSSIESITNDFKELGVTVTNVASRLNSDGSVKLTVKGLDQFKDAVTIINNIDKDGERTSWSQSISRDINEVGESFRKLKASAQEIGSLKIDIFKSDDADEIDNMTARLRKLQSEYDELFASAKSGLDANQINQLDSITNKHEAALSKLKREYAETRAELARKINIRLDNGTIDNEISNINSRFDRLKNKSLEIRSAMDEVNAALNRMQTASASEDIEALISANQKYERALKNVKNQLDINLRAEKDSASAIKLEDDIKLFSADVDSWIVKNSAAVDRFGARLREMKMEAQSADRVKLDSLQRELKQIDKDAEAAGLKMQTFTDRIKSQFQRYSSYLSVASVIMYAGQAMRDMFEQVKLIDSAMTELKKVTNETDESYNRFLSHAASRSKELGTTIDGFISSTADFARLGYGFKDAQGLAEAANIYAVVGDEIEGVEGATQSLVSTMAAFRGEMDGISNSDFAMSIVDKMNEVSNNFAISSGGIGEALQRSASSMAAANNTLDETIAMITAANEVTQNPEKVGNAMKTMSMRIRGAKTELEEAGESTDGMAESTASLRQEMLALSGVDIMLNENTFKSTYQIMDELSHKWENLSDIAQATIIELVAGKHQGNVFSSLMSNFDTARSALNTSLNSSGSAMKEHEKWSKSLEARLNKLKSTWQSLSQTFMNSDFLKVGLDFLTGFVDVLDRLIDKVGVIPTLIGGFTLFSSVFNKNSMFNVFKVLNTDLDGFTNRIGIANKSFTELINAFKFGRTDSGGIKDFFRGIQSVGNIFKSGTLSSNDIHSIQKYNDLIDNCVGSQTAWYKTMQNASPAAKNLVASANGGKVAINGLTAATKASTIATVGMTIAATAMNAAITMGISALITWGISKLDEWIETADELSERIDDVTSKYDEQHSSLMKIKGDYDTSNENSMISKYGELSKGVNELGENLSLTADEYAEYQNIVEQIASQNPKIVSGYNSQGQAILDCAGNIDELAQSYKNLVIEENNKVTDIGADIFKGFKNDLKGTSAYYKETYDSNKKTRINYNSSPISEHYDTKHLDKLQELLELSGENDKEFNDAVEDLTNDEINRLSALLEEQGIERNKFGSGDAGWENKKQHVIRALKGDKNEIKNVLDDAAADLNAYAENMGKVTEAFFSTAFLGGNGSDIGDYSSISGKIQNVITQITSGLGADFYTKFLDPSKTNEQNYKEFIDYYNSILDKFKNLDDLESAEFEAAFDLKTRFNSGDISYGEYVKGIQNASNLIEGLELGDELETQLKLTLNTQKVADDYDALKTRLTEKYELEMETEKAQKKAESFLNNLSASEYSVAIDLITNENINFEDFGGIKDLKEYIEKQAKLNEALNYTIAIDVEAESIEALNTAMAESVSGAGLSSESIATLKGRYKELESQGYDLSAMFEETSNGIHLNRKSVEEFEHALASQKLSETDGQLKVLKGRYDELTDEIKNCTDAGERANLYTEQQEVAQKINDLATLAAQYKGLTSAYNAWQSAESAGSERDMYESIIDGFETIGDEISRGWYDDGTIKFLELMTGETDLAGKSASELKNIWNGLDDTIKNTSYSVKDFFTVDEDGNSTSTGVYNFLRALQELESSDTVSSVLQKQFKDIENIKDLVTVEDGKITAFNFDVVGGDEAVAEALGISEELVQIMLRAADDAGFVVTLDGNYTQLADLKTSAEEANDTLKKFKKDGLAGLKDADLDFNFGANNLKDLNTELEKAMNVLDKFKDKNGKIKTDDNGNYVKGAKEALEIASYYQATIDKLTEPVYMQLETNQVEKDLQEPLEKMQEFERLSKEKHQLTLTGDTDDLEKTESKMNEIVDYIDSLGDETKVKLGIDGLSKEEIKGKLETGEIEIPATVDIQMEMSEDIKDMRLMMMNQLGLISDEQLKLEIEFDVDYSAVEEYSPEQQKAVVEYFAEHEEVDKWQPEDKKALVRLVAEKDNPDDWEAEDVDAVVKYYADDKQIEKWSPEEKKAFVEYIVDGGNVDKWTPEAKDAFVKYLVDGGDPDTFDPENKESWVVYKADSSDPDSYNADKNGTVTYGTNTEEPDGYNPDKNGTVTYDKDSKKVDRWNPNKTGTVKFNKDSSVIDKWKPVVSGIAKFTLSMIVPQSIRTALAKIGISIANGTANVDGTAFASGTATKLSLRSKHGKALKQGEWGVKRTETALTGELGQELVVYGNRFWTVGDTGAEFANIPKGAIVFNHRQTEEIFKHGKVTSGGGRGKIYANGSAFVQGTAYSNGSGGGEEPDEKPTKKPTKTPTTDTKTKTDSDSKSDNDFKESFDWIEIKISRIERAINRLDIKANSVYTSWADRNEKLADEISKVKEEIDIQKQAYDGYLEAAKDVGLSSEWAKKVREGTIDISTIKDEKLAEKIKEYQTWYEKAIGCNDAILELKETEASLYAQRVENVSTQYEGILAIVEHEKNMIEQYVSQSEAQGWLTSAKYYEALVSNENEKIAKLEKEKSAMLEEFNTAMKSGTIDENSEAWYEMVSAIDEVTLAIAESQTSIIEYQQTIQQLSWESFDLLQDKISSITEESEFLIDLMSNNKLYDDVGQLTDDGLATMGLHGVAYNINMAQADKYAAEAEKIKKQLRADPYDTELEERYREMISLQQEHILAAENEKNAIRDMVEEGIELELNALQERIDKYNETLDSQKALYDYQKKVKEQTEEIASLEKQISAYSGDTSEEAKMKIQELKVSLEEAKSDLEETEYDKYISDQQQLLDSLYLEYEEILNMRFDNIDALISDMISEINNNKSVIESAILDVTDSVGYTLSDSMDTIWDTNSSKIKNVITEYGEKFEKASTTTNNALSTINTNLQNMITQLNSIAKTNVKSASVSTSSDSEVFAKHTGVSMSSGKTTNTASKSIKVGGKINAGSAEIYDYAGDKTGERQLYRNDPIYKVLKTDGSWLQVRWHKLSSGVTGWFKKGDVKAYKAGAKRIASDHLAWTQEDGQEFILRPSDGAVLTPVAKNDRIFNANASNNLWDIANSPAEFIKENLNLGIANVPNNSNVQSNYTQHLDKVVFNLPNVKNYDELLSTMQKDKNFERLILSMSIDRLAGNSSLAKGKSIR